MDWYIFNFDARSGLESGMSARAFVASIGTCLLLASTRVMACSVCGAVTDEARFAYIRTTLLMSFVPLIVIGVIFYGAYKLYRRENPK